MIIAGLDDTSKIEIDYHAQLVYNTITTGPYSNREFNSWWYHAQI